MLSVKFRQPIVVRSVDPFITAPGIIKKPTGLITKRSVHRNLSRFVFSFDFSQVKLSNKTCNWQVEESAAEGRYLVARRLIKAGELILHEPPLVLGPKLLTSPLCLGCYKPVNGTYR